MACNCTPPSNTCTSCNPCVTTTSCTEPWTITNVVSNLTSCVTPEYCDDGCVDTIGTDCVMLSSDLTCTTSTILAGTSLTDVLSYLFCSKDYLVIADTTDACEGGANGTITVELEVSTWSLELRNEAGGSTPIQTITNPTLTFTNVLAGDYTVVLNGFVSIPVTVEESSDPCG